MLMKKRKPTKIWASKGNSDANEKALFFKNKKFYNLFCLSMTALDLTQQKDAQLDANSGIFMIIICS